MTIAELAKFDGRQGRPAYVAVSGVVYDLSSSPRWVEGNHEVLHQAGQDLTEELKAAPHIRAVVERFPVIGRIEQPVKQDAPARRLPWLAAIFGAVIVLIVLILISK